MTDIVERLKAEYELAMRPISKGRMLMEAAEEIERLREVAQAGTEEIERLCAAFRLIAEGFGPDHGSKYCRDIAQSANHTVGHVREFNTAEELIAALPRSLDMTNTNGDL